MFWSVTRVLTMLVRLIECDDWWICIIELIVLELTDKSGFISVEDRMVFDNRMSRSDKRNIMSESFS